MCACLYILLRTFIGVEEKSCSLYVPIEQQKIFWSCFFPFNEKFDRNFAKIEGNRVHRSRAFTINIFFVSLKKTINKPFRVNRNESNFIDLPCAWDLGSAFSFNFPTRTTFLGGVLTENVNMQIKILRSRAAIKWDEQHCLFMEFVYCECEIKSTKNH